MRCLTRVGNWQADTGLEIAVIPPHPRQKRIPTPSIERAWAEGDEKTRKVPYFVAHVATFSPQRAIALAEC